MRAHCGARVPKMVTVTHPHPPRAGPAPTESPGGQARRTGAQAACQEENPPVRGSPHAPAAGTGVHLPRPGDWKCIFHSVGHQGKSNLRVVGWRRVAAALFCSSLSSVDQGFRSRAGGRAEAFTCSERTPACGRRGAATSGHLGFSAGGRPRMGLWGAVCLVPPSWEPWVWNQLRQLPPHSGEKVQRKKKLSSLHPLNVLIYLFTT